MLKQQTNSFFLLYAWGQHLNSLKNRQIFRQHYFDGIIYDRVDEISNKIRLEISLTVNEKIYTSKYHFDPKFDTFYICGSNGMLGNWHLNKAIELKLNDKTQQVIANNSVWSTFIDFDLNSINKQFEYKYFIARKSSNNFNPLFLRQIEQNNRVYRLKDDFKNQSSIVTLNDTWGMDGLTVNPVVNGWLLRDQLELQLNFFNAPLKIISKNFTNFENNSLSIALYKIIPDGQLKLVNDFVTNFTVCLKKIIKINFKG